MKKPCLIAFAALCVAIQVGATAVATPASEYNTPKLKIRSMTIEQVMNELKLTPEQRELIRQIGESHHKATVGVPNAFSKEATLKTGGAFLNVLTPEQRAKFYELVTSERVRAILKAQTKG